MHDAGDADETGRLISADKVQGTKVYNHSGEKLGTVEKVMIDKPTGKVAYALMSFGGFLGIGDKHHPLPWNLLTYNTDQQGYTVSLDKAMLEKAPTVERDQPVNWEDETWGRELHDYYGVTPYWTQTQRL
jgi:sporulation protein YlmC with PRC-barrel domain